MTMTRFPSPLVKYYVVSAMSLCIGTLHGMLQVMPPIRHWLDSIGSPNVGPGHMIDPLAHAHMNLVGGVVLLAMGTTYHVLPQLLGRPVHSRRMLEHTFWWTLAGAYSFYVAELVFGIWEGTMLRAGEDYSALHRWHGPVMAVSGTVMAVGFFLYFLNIALTLRAPKAISSR
jgi:cytochrome c oxidase cbb3-type subunit 1